MPMVELNSLLSVTENVPSQVTAGSTARKKVIWTELNKYRSGQFPVKFLFLDLILCWFSFYILGTNGIFASSKTTNMSN
jgi:hypothetical protein